MQDTSLVIIDELGRATSPAEGSSLAFSVAEHLLSTKAFTVFATHFPELNRLEMYNNVILYREKKIIFRKRKENKIAEFEAIVLK